MAPLLAMYQLRQREAAADLHRTDPQNRAGGVHARANQVVPYQIL